MAKATFLLNSARDRGFAAAAVMRAPDGYEVVVSSKPKRTREQNSRLHACLSDVAEQLPWPKDSGVMHDIEVWKRRCTLSWLIEAHQEPEVITALNDTERFGILIPHSSDLDVEQCAALIEWIYAFATPHGVVWKEPKREDPPPPEQSI